MEAEVLKEEFMDLQFKEANFRNYNYPQYEKPEVFMVDFDFMQAYEIQRLYDYLSYIDLVPLEQKISLKLVRFLTT